MPTQQPGVGATAHCWMRKTYSGNMSSERAVTQLVCACWLCVPRLEAHCLSPSSHFSCLAAGSWRTPCPHFTRQGFPAGPGGRGCSPTG